MLGNTDSKYRVFGSHGKPEVNYEQLIQSKKAIETYLTDSSIKPVGQIDLFGSIKNIFKVGNVLFVDGYIDVFNDHQNDK